MKMNLNTFSYVTWFFIGYKLDGPKQIYILSFLSIKKLALSKKVDEQGIRVGKKNSEFWQFTVFFREGREKRNFDDTRKRLEQQILLWWKAAHNKGGFKLNFGGKWV